MAQGSRIEWTGSTWNPVVGCTKVSAGCENCYAERMAKRLAAMARADQAAGRDPGRKGNYVHVVDDRGHWNETVFKDYRALEDPLRWRSPRVVFVNSMSDLFHEDLSLDFIRAVFAVMNRCPQHTFQVLTKRPHVAAEYSGELCWTDNIWMGTTVENATVTHRVASVRRTHAQIKFLSVEPLLGPIPRLPLSGIHSVIVGGESGPGARLMKPEWVRQIRDRCIAQGLPFFFKQWGGVNKKRNGRSLDGQTWSGMPKIRPTHTAFSLAGEHDAKSRSAGVV